MHTLKYFEWSIAVLVVGLSLAFWRGESVFPGHGFSFLIPALIISVLEISLSFDNAVINAQKLEHMAPIWRRRFLTWGIAIAVFGMRFVFPILIVSLFSGLSMRAVFDLALHDPDSYARHLSESNVGISSFGGAFLMMLFCEFMFDRKKNVHWLPFIELKMKAAGKIPFIPTLLTFVLLLITQIFLDSDDRIISIISGTAGIFVHLAIHGASAKLDSLAKKENAFALKHAGLGAFIYLELIDASFSLDGVLGAFALTKDVVIITIGLAVGAFFVRSITVMLVEKKTLSKALYLTNGAYWAIGSLAVIMFISTICEVPEIITGGLGMAFILASLASSIAAKKSLKKS